MENCLSLFSGWLEYHFRFFFDRRRSFRAFNQHLLLVWRLFFGSSLFEWEIVENTIFFAYKVLPFSSQNSCVDIGPSRFVSQGSCSLWIELYEGNILVLLCVVVEQDVVLFN